MGVQQLFENELRVVNFGIGAFASNILAAGGQAIHVEWIPPLGAAAALSALREARERIDEANRQAVAKVLAGRPMLTGMGRAIDLVPGMKKNLLLHAGPPVTWERMCGPMRGGILAALMYEGLARSPEEAEALAASGEVEFSPCHEHDAVGPMAGIVSASMPVFVVRNEEHGNVAFCTQNEGLGKVLRYGAYSQEVLDRLRWMEETLYPTLQGAIAALGKVDIKSMIAQALHMGDELHNRNRAGTSLLFRALAPALLETAPSAKMAAESLRFINSNDHFFLNLSMPACKSMLEAARNTAESTLVIVMARNGTDFGIQLAGTGRRWFTGPAAVPDALFFPGFSKEDANPDIGDSAITETGGLGGFAIAAAPAIVQFVGGSAADARNYTLDMYEITLAEHNSWKIPSLDFRGTPLGIDARKVVETGILPFIDTGVAHRLAGVGQVGAGVLKAPAEPFVKAIETFAEELRP